MTVYFFTQYFSTFVTYNLIYFCHLCFLEVCELNKLEIFNVICISIVVILTELNVMCTDMIMTLIDEKVGPIKA